VAAAAADVGDRPEAAEVVGGENAGDIRGSLRSHCLPEDFGLAGMLLQVRPQPVRRDQIEGGRAGTN